MRGALYFETGESASLSLQRRGRFSRREESGYAALDGIAYDGTEYVTLTEYGEEDGAGLASAVCRELGTFLERIGIRSVATILVAGIGNGRIEADSLGPLVSERIAVGEKKGGIGAFSFSAGVPEATGIGTEKLIPAVARLVGADLIVAVDSLAAVSPERLCRAVQISSGARPGSGAVKGAGAIGEKDAGCPSVTLGVPTAVRGRLTRGEDSAEGLFTVCGVGSPVVFHADALAAAINSFCGS